MNSAGQMLVEILLPQMITVTLPILALVAVLMWAPGRASLRVQSRQSEP